MKKIVTNCFPALIFGFFPVAFVKELNITKQFSYHHIKKPVSLSLFIKRKSVNAGSRLWSNGYIIDYSSENVKFINAGFSIGWFQVSTPPFYYLNKLLQLIISKI